MHVGLSTQPATQTICWAALLCGAGAQVVCANVARGNLAVEAATSRGSPLREGALSSQRTRFSCLESPFREGRELLLPLGGAVLPFYLLKKNLQIHSSDHLPTHSLGDLRTIHASRPSAHTYVDHLRAVRSPEGDRLSGASMLGRAIGLFTRRQQGWWNRRRRA